MDGAIALIWLFIEDIAGRLPQHPESYHDRKTHMMTRQEFISFFSPIWAFRFDLEDGLFQELKEWRDQFKFDMEPEDDYTNLAECVNESLENYGYPTMPLDV